MMLLLFRQSLSYCLLLYFFLPFKISTAILLTCFQFSQPRVHNYVFNNNIHLSLLHSANNNDNCNQKGDKYTLHIDITYECCCVSKLGIYVHYYFLFFPTGDFSPFQKFLIIKVGFNTKGKLANQCQSLPYMLNNISFHLWV